MKVSAIPSQWAKSKQKSLWIDRFARSKVIALMQQMQDGCIKVTENNQVFEVGNPNSEMVADIVVKNPAFYRMLLLHGSIGAGEAYMADCWATSDVTKVVQVICRNMRQLEQMDSGVANLYLLMDKWRHRLLPNSKNGAKRNIMAHYDLSNELYQLFLDQRMMYSAALFNTPSDSLEQAQINKLERICQQLQLSENDHVVEIGSGWGGLAIYMAKQYGCRVTTTTISDAQFEYAKANIQAHGLEHKITLLNRDYRDLEGHFDKLVSIEMIEAVGHDYFPAFFKKCNALLKPSGLMLLQAITIPEQRYEYAKHSVDFIQRYIFPGGCLPSMEVILRHTGQHTQLQLENVQDIGIDYADTLKHWHQRFNHQHEDVDMLGFDDVFKRMWRFYLSYCEGGFREKVISTVQATFYKQ